MNLHPCEWVCTRVVLEGFGIEEPTYHDDYLATRYEDFVARLKKITIAYRVEQIGDNMDQDCWIEKLAVIEAVTTSQQKHANEDLEKLGFTRSPPYLSKKYGTEVYVWTMHIPAYLEAIGLGDLN